MTLSEIIQDIHGLDGELAGLEKRYGVLSAGFYHFGESKSKWVAFSLTPFPRTGLTNCGSVL